MFNKVISIEVGMLKTRICEMDYRKKAPHIYHCSSFDTPKHSLEDGYICDMEALAAVLKNIIKEAGIKSKRLVFTIASTKIANREVSIPYVTEQRISEIVKANASEYFPVDIKGFIIRYSVLEKYTAESEKRLRLLILAAPENMVKSYYELATKIGCEVAAIDYIGNSIFQMARHANSGIHLVVQMNEQMTFLNILENGVFSLPKTVHFGLMNILEVIKNQNSALKNDEEALNLLYSGKVTGWQQDASLGYLISSTVRIMEYYARNQGKKLQSIYLTGQALRIFGMKEYLQNELGVEVISLDPVKSIQFRKELVVTGEEREDYAACIGAAINPIGFLPKDHMARNRKSNNIHNLVFALTAGVLVSAILVSSSYISYKSQAIKNKNLSQELSTLLDINKIYEEYNQAAERLKEVSSLYEKTQSPNDEFNELLEQLERKLPAEAVVETISVNSQGITLSFRGDSEITAAKTIQQLKTIPCLSQISTDAISFSEDENGIRTVYYVINGTYAIKQPQEVSNGTTEENIGS